MKIATSIIIVVLGLLQAKKTLEDWLKAVPEATRKELTAKVDEALKGVASKEYYEVGNEISDLAKGRDREEYLPICLEALRKSKGKAAAALLHAIKVTGLACKVKSADSTVPLNGIVVATASAFVEDVEKDARLTAVSVFKSLAGGQVDLSSGKKTPSLDAEGKAALKKACEKAAGDKDASVKEVAEEALKRLAAQ